MALQTEAVGKTWPAVDFEIEGERISQYAYAVGAENPVHHDAAAAKEAGFRDLAAPPMFCVVYSAPAMGPAILDPEVGMNFAAMVHGGQEFEWGPLVVAGDEITTTASVKDISERGGMGFYVFTSVSTNQNDETVCTATWTNIVRGV